MIDDRTSAAAPPVLLHPFGHNVEESDSCQTLRTWVCVMKTFPTIAPNRTMTMTMVPFPVDDANAILKNPKPTTDFLRMHLTMKQLKNWSHSQRMMN